MTAADFTTDLEQQLQLTGRPFDRGTLIEFVEDSWPLIQDHPDADHWAREFIDTLPVPIEWATGNGVDGD